MREKEEGQRQVVLNPVNNRSSSVIYERPCPPLELYVFLFFKEILPTEIIVIWIPTRLNPVQVLLNKSVGKQVQKQVQSQIL